MAHTKRAWKLQEFVAHGSNVNCLAIGHKSGRVLVTGGEDRKVNLWAIGKPNCVMSLTGHTMPVEAVRFGHEEEMVVAGSISGALKVWDLEQAKIMRTLTGHKSSIRSLDFHPYGDYTASGSLDANVKLWDIRRKGCIYTYKGHTNCVNCVRFSPDGKWIASAGEDGLVKIWDLTAGKLMTDLNQHTGPVNIVEFHPNELLLASGSSDRTVKFWDLETFSMVSSTDGDSTPVRTIFFHPDGTCLFSGCRDLLKVYSWEPSLCHDTVPIAWGEVADMAMAQNQLIGASFSQTNVSSYVVDLQRIQPFGGVPSSDHGSSLSSSHRKSFITERPPTQSSRQASVPKEDEMEPTNDKEEPTDDKESSFDIKDPDDYREIFQPKSRLSHSPNRKVEPFQPPPEDVSVDNEPVRQPAPVTQRNKTTAKPTPKPATSKPSVVKQPAKTTNQQAKISPRQQQISSPPKEKEPPGIAAEDFLPKGIGDGDLPGKKLNLIDDDVMGTIEKGHSAMMTVIANRSKNLQIVRAMWTSGSTKAAVDSAISMKDPSVIVDLLNVLNLKSGLWNLDLCNSLLPHFEDLMHSKYESYVTTVCSSLKVVLKNFGPVIKANLTAPPSVGVDISREERYRKCNACYAVLMKLRGVIEKKSNVQGPVGPIFREIQILMATLD